jgi:hypothetical protein
VKMSPNRPFALSIPPATPIGDRESKPLITYERRSTVDSRKESHSMDCKTISFTQSWNCGPAPRAIISFYPSPVGSWRKSEQTKKSSPQSGAQ